MVEIRSDEDIETVITTISWHDSFSFFPISVSNDRRLATLISKLETETGSVLRFRLESPEQASELAVNVRATLEQSTTVSLVLIELHTMPFVAEWIESRRFLLARFNEMRNVLERICPCPFIITVPSSELSSIADSAPDLWSFRGEVFELSAETVALPSMFSEDVAIVPNPNNELPEILRKRYGKWLADVANKDFRSLNPLEGFRIYNQLELNGSYYLAMVCAKVNLDLVRKQNQIKSKTLRDIYSVPLYLYALNYVGQSLLANGQPDQAILHLEELKKNLERMAKDENSTDIQYELATAIKRIGQAYFQSNNPAKAAELLVNAVEKFRKLVKRRASRSSSRDLPEALNTLGHVYMRMGQPLKAIKAFEELVRISREVEVVVHSTSSKCHLADDLRKLGFTHFKTDNYTTALFCFLEALEILKGLTRDELDAQNVIFTLERIYRGLWLTNLKLGDSEKGEFYKQKAEAISNSPSI